MLPLLRFFGFLKRKYFDHDSVDDFNTRIVCWSALAVGFLLFASQYGINSVQCYERAEWKDGWRNSWLPYANDLCFVEGTYFVDTKSNLPHYNDLSKHKKVIFYQWTPFLYLLFALMFYLPRMYWSGITSSSYMYFRALCYSARTYRDGTHKNVLLLFVAEATRNPARMPSHFCLNSINRLYDDYIGKRYLIATYLFFKIWHIVNIVVAHVLLSILVGDNRQDPLGISTISTILSGVNWEESGVFPRTTTCEIRTRHYGKGNIDIIKHVQIQCSLSANAFIEKIFIVTWFFFLCLFMANVYNLYCWIKRIWTSKAYVVEKIELTMKLGTEKAAEFADLLLPDARFTMLMVEVQSADMVDAKDLVFLYINYRRNLPSSSESSSSANSDSE